MTLDQYLKQQEIKASDFAAQLGKPASTITRLIKGERRPSLALMQEIARATGGSVTANDFLRDIDNPPTSTSPDAADDSEKVA